MEDNDFKELKSKTEDMDAFEDWVIERESQHFKPYSYPFIVLGTFVLWVSWLFFNGGSTTTMFAKRTDGVEKIIMNTILAAAAGGLTAVKVRPLIAGKTA